MMEQHLKQQVRYFLFVNLLIFLFQQEEEQRQAQQAAGKSAKSSKNKPGKKGKAKKKKQNCPKQCLKLHPSSIFYILDSVRIGRMAPTIGSASGSRSPSAHRRQQGAGVERSGLVCRVKYTNTLPDIPFDSKSIKYPFSRNRFLEYKPTTLEKLCKVELHTDFDLGVNIDLINPETYIRPPGVELEPDDNALLQDDDSKKNDTKR